MQDKLETYELLQETAQKLLTLEETKISIEADNAIVMPFEKLESNGFHALSEDLKISFSKASTKRIDEEIKVLENTLINIVEQIKKARQ